VGNKLTSANVLFLFCDSSLLYIAANYLLELGLDIASIKLAGLVVTCVTSLDLLYYAAAARAK